MQPAKKIDWGKRLAALRQRPDVGKAATVTVSRATASLRALGADGKLLAFFPVTVGSDSLPSPTGTHKVKLPSE